MKEIAAASADKKEDDPFLISTRTTFGRKLISDLDICHLPQNLPADFENPLLPGGFRNRDNITQQRQALLLRLGSAVLGGIALVGPMLLMELHKSFATSLVTVSVAVMIIGVGIALFIPDAKPRDVVVAVAGYAAVLVVFVGTSS
jgi:VIT1/CCC1 family predicted Fe2+/Mn2+ transporter